MTDHHAPGCEFSLLRDSWFSDWVSRGLTSHSTLYRSFRGRFFTGQMTRPTASKHWMKPVGCWDRLQSHQNHSPSLTTLDLRQVVAPSMLTDPSQHSKHPSEGDSPVLVVTCSTQHFRGWPGCLLQVSNCPEPCRDARWQHSSSHPKNHSTVLQYEL